MIYLTLFVIGFAAGFAGGWAAFKHRAEAKNIDSIAKNVVDSVKKL